MNIQYTASVESLDANALHGFFVGWPKPPSNERLLTVLRNSERRVIAMDGPRVVGFCTSITDGELAAYIPFLEVLPSHRGNGIGKTLIEQMMEQLKGFYMVDLVCDEALESFYAKLGFSKAIAMVKRNYDSL